ncbi:hypothetical protein Dsin_016910 [Dipteronia sinensis]|uniref:Reverse transcriptase zinc-binding domain-containing protein n=1 Tax=Dipteronia sinensis TaxID=43782 RepID=A0AAE0AEA4_9ROSI|nr:hypothetical protein Dsin_016910 [Dipteronia sinensis]
MPNPGSDLRVADLLDRNRRGWDVDKLDRVLLPVDNEIILSILVSWSGGSDSLAWHFDKGGVYTVRSGYRLALSQKVSESVFDSSVSQQWWKILWGLNLLPRVKFFDWRACWNTIPSLENLWKRKVVASPQCDRCTAPIESSSHAIFWCKEVKKVWNCVDFLGFFAKVHLLPNLEIFSLGPSLLGMEDLCHLCMLAWAIWDNRNLILFNGKAIRDDKGLVLAARFNQLLGLFNPVMGELLALRKGLLLALFYNIHVDFAEVVSPTVVSILNDPNPIMGDSKFVVQDIKTMFLDVGICRRYGDRLLYLKLHDSSCEDPLDNDRLGDGSAAPWDRRRPHLPFDFRGRLQMEVDGGWKRRRRWLGDATEEGGREGERLSCDQEVRRRERRLNDAVAKTVEGES